MSKLFHYVYIPAVLTQPIQQCTLEYNDSNAIEILINTLKKHYESVSVPSVSLDQMKQQLQSTVNNKNIDLSTVNDHIIQQMYNNVTIDQIILYNNKLVTSYTGLAMYVDDRGQLKNLSRNQRASSIAQSCQQSIDVLGDVFIARYYDNDETFIRFDFTLDELNQHSDIFISISQLTKSSNDPQLIDRQLRNTLGSNQLKYCALGLFGCYNEAKHRCARCKNISYCSAEHQRLDWKRHKQASCSSNNNNNIMNVQQSHMLHNKQHGTAAGHHGHTHDGIHYHGSH